MDPRTGAFLNQQIAVNIKIKFHSIHNQEKL
jgi:hypothetical protein